MLGNSPAQPGADKKTGNLPINFYGRAIDQDGNALSDAKVSLEIHSGTTNYSINGGMRVERLTTSTDANGNFAVINKEGHSITVSAIEKEGFELSPKVARMYSYRVLPIRFHSEPNAPVIFKMWKKQGAEHLQNSAWHGNIVPDGNTITFNLRDGKRADDGDLQITCKRVPLDILPREHKRYDYSLTAVVVGGGIMPTEDEFTFLAPEVGYMPSVKLGAKANDLKWVGSVKQEFYIKTSEGHYGRLSVDWYGDLTSPTHFEWDSSINPSGSRNLER